MSPILFANHFLAGSILSLVLPVGLLVAIAVWYVLGVKRYGSSTVETRPGADTPPPVDRRSAEGAG